MVPYGGLEFVIAAFRGHTHSYFRSTLAKICACFFFNPTLSIVADKAHLYYV